MSSRNLRVATGLSSRNVLETLESRTLMSAVPMTDSSSHHAVAMQHVQAAASATAVSIVVNTVADSIDAPGSSTVSLRDAIAKANASNVATNITFKPTVFGSAKTIKLIHGVLEVHSAGVTRITGPTAGVTISGNGVSGGFLIDAGATASLSRLTVSNCSGAEAISNNGTLGLTDSTLKANTARGLYNSGTASLLRDTLSGNSYSGYGGGAAYNDQGTLVLTNCTVANNSSTGYCGGILNYAGTLKLSCDTIAGNTGTDFGGGVFTYFGGSATLADTLVANNSCAGFGNGPDIFGAVTSNGHNLVGKTDGSSGWNASDYTGTAASPLNANLGALANNGGPTLTMLPQNGSPAIDHGSNAGVPSGITTDQRGLGRVMFGTVDIGAAERQSAPVVSVSVTTRFGNELVITATGTNDSISISQSGSTLTIIGDGKTFTATVPAAGVFVYTRGGSDSISIGASVAVRTTVDSIDAAATTITSSAANVIAWTDSTDSVSGVANVHKVSSFAEGVSKALHASMANPYDAGSTAAANLSLFGAGPVASDINQGEVGDCYFLASLAGFANQHPQTLLNSAVDLGDGTFAVEFFSNGNPVFVRVNNQFSTGGFNGWMYAHPGTNNTMWAMVMEKAFCYFRYSDNSYNSINGGWMSEVYTDLGVGSNDIQPNTFSDNQLYNTLASELTTAKPVTMATCFSTTPDLVGGHAYTLIGVQTVNGVHQYIVRNPWGVSGDALENSQGIATLTYQQFISNFSDATLAN